MNDISPLATPHIAAQKLNFNGKNSGASYKRIPFDVPENKSFWLRIE